MAPPSPSDPGPLPSKDTEDTVEQIKAAIGEWEETVKWDKTNGDNIIQTNGSVVRDCDYPGNRPSRNQVIFYGDAEMDDLCGDLVIACWRRPGTLVASTPPGSIIMRSSLDWMEPNAGNCFRLHATLIHESGHSLGFGHSTTRDSIMFGSYNSSTWNVCEPTAYDVAAMMANYQSR